MSAAAPDSIAALELLAPQARWTREPLPELGAELVVLPTKLPNRFVVVKGRVAEATLEAAAPLWAPLDAARATQLVQAIARAELVDVEAPARLRAAAFSTLEVKHAALRGPFVFERLELRSAQSEPVVVSVRLALNVTGVRLWIARRSWRASSGRRAAPVLEARREARRFGSPQYQYSLPSVHRLIQRP